MRIGKVEIDLWLEENSHNDASNNERMVEVPLAQWFLNKYKDPIEFGAVTPYYFKSKHLIFDPTDPYENCIKLKAEDICYKKKTVLSISTVEHIGTGDYGMPVDKNMSVKVLIKMMKAKHYLITFPKAYNEILDVFAENMPENIIKLKRIENQKWYVADTLKDVKYHYPFSCGNGIYIITNCEELLK
jgi:hypothetical protein